MARDMAEVDVMKMEREQLKKEVPLAREPFSKTLTEIVEHVESMATEDLLIKGVPEDKNPFKGDKGGCIIT